MIKKISIFLYTNYPKQYGFFLGCKEKIFLPFKKFFFKLGFNVYFSNKDQDKWIVENIFNYKKNGNFVDLAATDGIHENNTVFLEKRLNWKGICIEPNKKFYKKLSKNRKVNCICKVIYSENTEIDFFSNEGIGGIVGSDFDNNYQKREHMLNKTSNKNKIEKRQTSSLEDILNNCGAPPIIDYLSLDVEGAETEVMKYFPYEKYKFLALTIERPTKELNEILFKNDYLFVKNYKVDSFYIHESLKDKISIEFENFSQVGKKQW